MTSRPYNFETFKRTIGQIWSISRAAIFRMIEHGLFVMQFANSRDRNKVLEGCPWTFDQNLVMMTEIEGSAQPSEIALTHCRFWVRLYNLHLDCRTEEHVRLIGGRLGTVMEIEADGIPWDKSARLKISLNITKPLRRVCKIRNSRGVVVLVDN